MKVNVVVAVYKDVEVLELILKSLARQTYKNFEAVVVEDGNAKAMKNFIEFAKKKFDFGIVHTFQKDIGVRKARSQNNGLLVSSGEYLIFIDGDCIPYSNFIEGHVFLSQPKHVLSGRRMNIPINLVPKVKEQSLSLLDIEEKPWKYIYLAFQREVRFKQGVYINPKGLIYKFITRRKISTSLLGCNFSCYKSDIIAINGFDESYGETAIPDDMDLEWRFQAYGLKLKSCKNVANMFHLDHKIHDRGDATPYLKIMNERKKNGQYVCDKGLNTHDF